MSSFTSPCMSTVRPEVSVQSCRQAPSDGSYAWCPTPRKVEPAAPGLSHRSSNPPATGNARDLVPAGRLAGRIGHRPAPDPEVEGTTGLPGTRRGDRLRLRGARGKREKVRGRQAISWLQSHSLGRTTLSDLCSVEVGGCKAIESECRVAEGRNADIRMGCLRRQPTTHEPCFQSSEVRPSGTRRNRHLDACPCPPGTVELARNWPPPNSAPVGLKS
jgi:hypothetical protein